MCTVGCLADLQLYWAALRTETTNVQQLKQRVVESIDCSLYRWQKRTNQETDVCYVNLPTKIIHIPIEVKVEQKFGTRGKYQNDRTRIESQALSKNLKPGAEK